MVSMKNLRLLNILFVIYSVKYTGGGVVNDLKFLPPHTTWLQNVCQTLGIL
jgi:hypothetical protein